jgi:K+-transporting ATPase A subunit
MNTRIITVLTLCLTFALTIAVGAQTETTSQPGTRTPGVKTRQKIQAKRIRHGVRNKELTARETASVMKGAKEIREDKREAKADGTVTGAERREIHQDMNQNSRKIYRKKHNNRTRR